MHESIPTKDTRNSTYTDYNETNVNILLQRISAIESDN